MQNEMNRSQIVKQYGTDCSDEEWEIAESFLRRQKTVGTPSTLAVRQVFNAIRYLTRSACQWRNLPKEFPKYDSVY